MVSADAGPESPALDDSFTVVTVKCIAAWTKLIALAI